MRNSIKSHYSANTEVSHMYLTTKKLFPACAELIRVATIRENFRYNFGYMMILKYSILKKKKKIAQRFEKRRIDLKQLH